MKETGQLRTGKHLSEELKSSKKKIDQDIIIKMFDNLKGKVHTTNETGLNSLLKI